MLANILRDMYVDPALLSELDDDQKNVLFCKMREEQIRRWKQREESDKPVVENKAKTKSPRKKVVFLLGADGKPWTWVMDEEESNGNGNQTKTNLFTSDNVNDFLANDRRGPLRPTSLPIRQENVNDIVDRTSPMNNRVLVDKNAINTSVSKGSLIVANGKLKAATEVNGTPVKSASQSPIPINGSLIRETTRPVVEVRPMIMTSNEEANNKDPVGPRLRNSEPPKKKGLEEELQRLVCDVVPLSSPTQPDKQKWLQEKQEQRKARDHISTSPLTPPDSPPRNEIFKSSMPKQHPLSPHGDIKISPTNQDWNSIDEQAWLEQEKRAKEADAQRRLSARNAREEIKRSSQIVTDSESIYACFDAKPAPNKNGDNRTDSQKQDEIISRTQSDSTQIAAKIEKSNKPAILPKPSVKPEVPVKPLRNSSHVPLQATSRSKDAKVFDRAEVELWFVESQLNKGAVSERGLVGEAVSWFHGFSARSDAEEKLQTLEEGSFLVRVHDRIKGYVVSFKSSDKVKHFLVDASQPNQVQFFGANQIVFRNIVHLVHFHTTQPVSVAGNELLLRGVPLLRVTDTTDAIRL